MDPHRRLRRQVAAGVQYPFALVAYGKNLYYTDWRRYGPTLAQNRSEPLRTSRRCCACLAGRPSSLWTGARSRRRRSSCLRDALGSTASPPPAPSVQQVPEQDGAVMFRIKAEPCFPELMTRFLPSVYNYCSDNAGCSHLCLPRLGGFTCRCPDASHAQCVDAEP